MSVSRRDFLTTAVVGSLSFGLHGQGREEQEPRPAGAQAGGKRPIIVCAGNGYNYLALPSWQALINLLDELKGDLFFDLVCEIEIGPSTRSARLHDNRRHFRFDTLDANPDIPLIDFAFNGFDCIRLVVQSAFSNQHTIRTQNLF